MPWSLEMEKFVVDSVRELLEEGRQISKQMQMNLRMQQSSSSSSDEIGEYLLHKTYQSYDNALTIIQNGNNMPPPPISVDAVATDRIRQTDDSDRDLKEHQDPTARNAVSICCPRVEGIEGQLDDGYTWRKYGQKEIMGAKYPRGYYRCIHKHDQGCLATKQVQRSNNDPAQLEIIYKRRHTCNRIADYMYDPNPQPGPKQFQIGYPALVDQFSFPSMDKCNSAENIMNPNNSQCELSKIFSSTTAATESESNFSFREPRSYTK